MQSIKRIYHHFKKWEDAKAGLYKSDYSGIEADAINKCIALLCDVDALYRSMKDVSLEWKFSSEHNLTNSEQNRRAWLGQAACCKEFSVHDGIVKKAWKELSNKERRAANNIADNVIIEWINSQSFELFLQDNSAPREKPGDVT